jgi:hypothetical protein
MPIARATFAIATLAVALATSAHAGTNTAAIEHCQAAITERLGVESASYELEKVHTSMLYRDYTFSVSAQPTSDAVHVTCRARKTNTVQSLTFAGGNPSAGTVATK